MTYLAHKVQHLLRDVCNPGVFLLCSYSSVPGRHVAQPTLSTALVPTSTNTLNKLRHNCNFKNMGLPHEWPQTTHGHCAAIANKRSQRASPARCFQPSLLTSQHCRSASLRQLSTSQCSNACNGWARHLQPSTLQI